MSLSLLDPAAIATRDGVIESLHLAHVVVASADGATTAIMGDPDTDIYPRSALKPFQAVAVRSHLASLGMALQGSQLAITCASHTGSDDHQIEAASLLAEAGLVEDALGCPPDWPADAAVRSAVDHPTALAHNCSGKHAAMLWAHTAGDQPAETYLGADTPLQQAIAQELAVILGQPPRGPGTDGCGAPAWRCSLGGLATGFARLMAGTTPGLAAVRDAMACHPLLIGGRNLPDTAMMWADTRVVAKRGYDGVMGCAFDHPAHGPLGVAVKVLDGGDRAAGPIAASVLHALGAALPTDVLHVPVLGGLTPHGTIAASPTIASRTTDRFGLS
ncbi:MAG TPA: asparaginase [Euzebya sp.]|nr:asparaginase [Euzebya sp.]